MHGPREHTDSYYSATRNIRTDYPPLQGEHRADVVVVGGGFTGISAALHLAERGYDVLVVEANRIGWGASGRNGGQLIDGFVEAERVGRRAGAAAAELVQQMEQASRDLVVDRIRQYNIDCDLKFGFLYLAARDSELRALEDLLAARQRQAYAHEMRLLGRQRLKDYLGSEHYLAALLLGGNGQLHPLNLCAAEARAAVERGARVFEQSRVARVRHGSRPVVETEAGRILAGKVVLAGNAYLGAAEPRLRGRVIPAGSYIMATEPLDDTISARLLPGDAACCDYCLVPDYFRLTPERRMLFGGLCTYSGRDPTSIEAALRPRMQRVFPELAGARVDYRWGGQIAISLNRIPQFGRIEHNTYYAQGFSGHGVAPAHLAGKLLADALAGDSEQFDVFARIRHLALPGGRWFANPALALGMLYLRLLELF
jgi:gamma-glutamylputrescine oxidase